MSPEVPVIILIIAIPTYFILLWVLRKLKEVNDKIMKWVALISAFILSPIIYVVLIKIAIGLISYHPTKEFDQTEWNSNVEERYEMSEDIIKSEMLIGKTQTEVIEILGSEYSSKGESWITYELGRVPGLFNIDPDFLEIKFENGTVVSVTQYGG